MFTNYRSDAAKRANKGPNVSVCKIGLTRRWPRESDWHYELQCTKFSALAECKGQAAQRSESAELEHPFDTSHSSKLFVEMHLVLSRTEQ